uniref:Selenoprotein I n=1 Tax=Ciona savignyi TaxID=51511 RepID=H2Y788_CIOSA
MLVSMYLTSVQLESLKRYKYKCIDTSPFNRYMLDPFYSKLVEFFPRWLSPNVITTVGFAFTFTQFLVLAYYDGDFSLHIEAGVTPVPRWAWFYAAFAAFTYHTLDGCDGKQARRTRTQSPLGEILDHGFDAWGVLLYFSSSFCLVGMHTVTPETSYYMLVSFLFSFFVTHWEKYVTGVFVLPWCADPGFLFLAATYLGAGMFGEESLHQNMLGLCSVKDVFLWTIAVHTSVISLTWSVRLSAKMLARNPGQEVSASKLWLPLISPLVAFLSLGFWGHFSPSNILEEHPRWFFLLCALVFSDTTIRLILHQMTNTSCAAINKSVTVCALSSILIVLSGLSNLEFNVLQVVTFSLVIMHVHFFV